MANKRKRTSRRSATVSDAGALMGRARFANIEGRTFGGTRDLYTTLGYDRQINIQQYRSRFRRGGVAGRIVEARPEDTWRGGGELIEDADSTKDTKFEKDFAELDERLHIWSIFRRADILAGIGRYAIIVLGAPGEMDQPLLKCGPKELAYLSVYAEDDASIVEFENNTKDPRFGLPRFYQIKRSQTSGTNIANITKRVHHSRVLHIADGLLDDEVFGTPRLERPWNRLDDLEKVVGGGAEAFWKRADQGQQFNLDPTMELNEEEIKAMEAEVSSYVHNLKRVMRTRGMEIKSLGSDVADFKGPADAVMAQISAITGIPQRILMGSEQAKLAAEQDSARYYQGIESRRMEFAQTRVVRPFVNRLIALGTVSKPKKDYSVKWSQIRTKDDNEKAALANSWADVNQKSGTTVVTANEIRQHCLGLTPLAEVVSDEVGNEVVDRQPSVNPNPQVFAGKGVEPWEPVQRAADRFRRKLQRQTQEAFAAGREALDLGKLKVALHLKDEMGVMMRMNDAIIAVEQALGPALEATLGEVLDASGKAAVKAVLKAKQIKKADLRAASDFGFDVTNPRAVDWIKNHAAETVTGVSNATRKEIRDLVEQAFEEQFSVDDLADEIADVVGDKARAEVIARTETMRASNVGQQEGWAQAQEEGLLTGRELQEWITTPDDRLCPICEPLDGKTTGLDGTFEVDGEQIDGPPAHPQCRCTVALSLETA